MDQQQQKPNMTLSKWRLVNLAFELGFVIALPLVGFGLLGKWLDEKYNTEPLFVLVGILVAIISTTIWLTRRIKEYIK